MTRWILLEPEDVLLFRDGRPFTAGDDFRAEGVFPPQPGPVVGALRAALLSPRLLDNGKTFQSLRHQPDPDYGGPDSLGRLQFRGPFICRFRPGDDSATLLLPAPADLLGERVPRLKSLPTRVVRSPFPALSSPLPIAVLPGDAEKHESRCTSEGDHDWLEEGPLLCYLLGAEKISRSALHPATPETRIGIQNGPQGTVAEGKFYNALTQRPEWTAAGATGLLMEIELPEGCDLPPGYVCVGGESRSLYQRDLDGFTPLCAHLSARHQIAAAILKNGGRFKLLLATPGIFCDGVLPRSLREGILGDISLECVAVATGKPVAVSGWSLQSGESGGGPRALRRAVPPGSVYYGNLTDPSDAGKLVEALHFTNALQETETDLKECEFRARQGFGVTLVGTWLGAEDSVAGIE